MIPHLYIHIPFCESKCPYCAFESGVFNDIDYASYIKALLATVSSYYFETIYIGGGTPSVIPAQLYEPIFNKLTANEISIEVNPSSATLEWLTQVRKFGANRLSIGVQSVRNDKLKLLGRRHNASKAKKVVFDAYMVGFERISIDLMYDTSLDSLESINNELDEILTWPIDHISLYSLTIEKNTPFYSSQHLRSANDETSFLIANKLKQHGLEHYEVASFGKTKCAHNLGYWSGAKYCGIGFGAVGFDGAQRYFSGAKNVYEYIANPHSLVHEDISEKERNFERIFLGLRSIIGVPIEILTAKQLEKCEFLLANDKIKLINNYLYNQNFWLSDEIALFIGI